MYPNLRAEMARRRVSNADLADAIGCNVCTVSDKLNKPCRLKLDEAIRIRDRWFPDVGVEYLFASSDKTQ